MNRRELFKKSLAVGAGAALATSPFIVSAATEPEPEVPAPDQPREVSQDLLDALERAINPAMVYYYDPASPYEPTIPTLAPGATNYLMKDREHLTFVPVNMDAIYVLAAANGLISQEVLEQLLLEGCREEEDVEEDIDHHYRELTPEEVRLMSLFRPPPLPYEPIEWKVSYDRQD